jgi:cell pole-organizing protein PopZ
MSQTAKAQEPSMEEILASIRRIIADDDSGKSAARGPEPTTVKPAPPVMAAPRPAPTLAAPRVQPPPASKQDEVDAVLAQVEPAKPKPQPLKPAPSPAAEVLDPKTPGFRTIDGASDVVFTGRTLDPAQPRPLPPAATAAAHAVERDLISTATRAAVDSAFNSLANTVLGNNARTLEDLVKEMLRPMLRSWLDDNLPGLVERLVRAEIERVSRGR